ncbi:protein of unknown function [Blastococcus saxobsidens DD2]|uniref:Uncharacterized protein n=1 Tax=Blastococcus saxobsidens (strain DD2) TaxID=1146883 RepID=H6RVA6_BLASD|nr:protein of unknown function [Blastococcus saxobsidens DD2]
MPAVCAGRADPTGGAAGTPEGRVPLGCPYNYTGGEWSRLRSGDQGKRAEEGNDELVNHPLQKTQAPIPIALTTLSLPDGS